MTAKKQGVNLWKLAFGLLALVNIGFIIFIYMMFFVPAKTDIKLNNDNAINENSSQFTVRTTKQNVTNLANAYIEKALENTGHHYQLQLADTVHINGELPFFSTTVPLFIELEPTVLANGDIKLKQRNLSIGRLKLPNETILNYVSKHLPVPDWVVIDANKEEIYVHLTEMRIQSNFNVHAEKFDLQSDEIIFNINVPYDQIETDNTMSSEKTP